MTRSLALQISSLVHCVSIASRNGADETVLANAEAGLNSLRWVERNTDTIREVHRLMTTHPAIIELLREFPGITSMSVKESEAV